MKQEILERLIHHSVYIVSILSFFSSMFWIFVIRKKAGLKRIEDKLVKFLIYSVFLIIGFFLWTGIQALNSNGTTWGDGGLYIGIMITGFLLIVFQVFLHSLRLDFIFLYKC